MREEVGSFTQLRDINAVIREGVRTQARSRRRQVVSILLVKQDGKAICLCVAKGALRDQRLNLSPPQGSIERGELLHEATLRELREELDVSFVGKILYLGSAIRVLPPDHRHAKRFDDCHHHWVAAFANSDRLRPSDSQAEACWHYLDTLDSLSQVSMSKDKAGMFSAAFKKLISISGDPYLIRPERFGVNTAMVA